MFALKCGTAINLFCRDMPRLSVDIDLTYLPVAERLTSLKDIADAFDRIGAAISRRHRFAFGRQPDRCAPGSCSRHRRGQHCHREHHPDPAPFFPSPLLGIG